MQNQINQARQLEQTLAGKGIMASPGVSKLSTKDLRMLGLSDAELAGMGFIRGGEKGGLGSGALGWEERRAFGEFPGIGRFAGMLGMNAPMMGVAAGAMATAGIVEAGKGLLDAYREDERAVRDLSQAYRAVGLDYNDQKKSIDDWIDHNKEYISNVADAREGFAKMTRAGIEQVNIQQAMNDALNLSAAKHIDLSQAIEQVVLGAEGSGRGLRDLGIQIKDYSDLTASGAKALEQINAAQQVVKEADIKLTDSRLSARDADIRVTDAHIRLKNAIDNYGASSSQAKLAQDAYTIAVDNAKKAHNGVTTAADASTKAHQKLTDAQDTMANKAKAQGQYFDDLGGKVKGGTNNFDDLDKASNRFGASMHKLADDAGPSLLTALTAFVNALDWAVGVILATPVPAGQRQAGRPGPPGSFYQPSAHPPPASNPAYSSSYSGLYGRGTQW